MSKINFGGIVAVGSSQGQAVQRYRLLTMGKGARCFVDQANGIAFVSNASADLESTFNPINGNLDLSLSDETLEGLEFQAQASDTQDAYWMHCTAGCGAHSVFDSEQLVKHCPMCGIAADQSEDDADEEDSELDDLIVGNEDDDEVDIDEESIDEEEEVDEDEGADEEDNSALAADDDNDSDDEDDSDDDSDEDDSDDDDSDEDLDDDVEEVEVEEVDTEENDDMADDNAPLVVVASSRSRAVRRYAELMSKSEGFTATASGEVNADYKVCASDEGCGSHVVSSEELHVCPAEGCGAELSEPVLALDPNAGELADDEENAEDNEFIEADEDDVDEESDDDISEEDEDEAVDDADEETEELDEVNNDGVGDDNSLTITAGDNADGNVSESEDEDQEADEDIAGQSDDVEADDSDTVELDLLEEMPADAEEADLDIAFASSVAGVPTYIALHKGRPVATATAASIRGDIADLFGTSRFTQVVVAAARIKNPKEVLIDLGFKGVAASLNVSANVQSRVDAGVATARAAMEEERGEFAERFKSALATASIGITRGYFAGLQNDVREALCSELVEAGIRNPESIVDRAMKNGMEPFLAAAMDKADQIMEKAPEVQEELARTVVEMGYKPVEGKLSAVAADHNASHRLDGIGHVVTASSGDTDNKKPASTTQIVAQASDQQATARINNAVATLGRLRR